MMKDKWITTVTTLLMAVCMTGCSAKHLEDEKAEYAIMAPVFENVTQTRAVVVPKTQEINIQALNKELFDEQGMSIWRGKNNALLALKGDALYLYDVASAQIKAETKTEHWNYVDFYPYKDGYCAIGQIWKGEPAVSAETGAGPQVIEVSRDDFECICIFYDDSLKEMSKISLFDVVENAEVAEWAVSPDGTMLGCFDQWEGLNIYDLRSQEKRNLLKLWNGGNCTELLTIDAIFFDEDSRHIVFTGESDQSDGTVASWGRIGIDGTGLENHILQHDFGMAAGYGDGKLLLGEDSIFFKGGMGFVDAETGKAMYKTDIKGALPMSGPFFSADGTVFATAALDTNQMEVTVWRTEDFFPLYKEVIQDDREEMFYRAPQVCLFPDLGVCIVCMGGHNDIPQKSVLLNY